MSKPASERTLFIRTLLVALGGVLTHQQVRPKLEAEGYDLAPVPPDKSENYVNFENHMISLLKVPQDKVTVFRLRKKHMDQTSIVERALNKCKLDDKASKALMAEVDVRMAYDAEANDFNVIKNTWKLDRGTSSKPESSKNSKAKAVAAVPTTRKVKNGKKDNAILLPTPKHRRNAAPVVSNDPLAIVKSNGGMAACMNRIAKLQSEIDSLQEAVNAVKVLQDQIAAAA